MGTRRIAVCVFLIMISGMIVTPANAGDSSDNSIDNTSCIIYADPPTNSFPINAGAACDDWDPSDDGTPNHQDWVVGNYQIEFQDSATIDLTMEWRIHEFARTSFSGIEFDIDGQGDGDTDETMGIPVDYVRNYFDIDADGPGGSDDTVSDMVLKSASENVESLASNFGTSDDSSTFYAATVEDIDNPGGIVSCSFMSNNDAISEGSGTENAYYPPLCIRSTVEINLDQDKLNFIGGENTNQENTLQGLLKMGTTIKMPFSIFAQAGHNSQFTIHPPVYGDINEVGSDECDPLDLACYGEKKIHVNMDSSTYHKGIWKIDNTDANDGDSQLNREIWYKLVSNDPVNIDINNDKSLNIDVTLDLEDENNAELQIDLYVHYISDQTMNDWGFQFMDNADFAETPWITSEGIRLVQHNEIADLSTLASQFPIEGITDAFESIIGTEIDTGPLEWRTNVENTAGINLVHDSGTCANVGTSPHNHYCLQGEYAMDDTFPVLMTSSTENTFKFRLLDLITQQMDTDALPVNLSELSNEDLETVLNSGLELGVDLGEDYIQTMIPEDLPPTEVSFNIVLPSWLDTKDKTGIISLESRLDGSGNTAIELKGNNPWEWDHPIMDRSVEPAREICKATQKTCMKADIKLDFEELDIDEWSKAITLTLGGEVSIDIYRIGVDGSLVPEDENGNQISIEAIPSDLLRQIVYFDTTEPIFSDEIPLFGKTIQFELTETGIHQFAKDLGDGLTEQIQSNSIEDENIKIDLSAIKINTEIENLYSPDAGEVSDLAPLRMKLELEKTTVVASYSESGISVMTSKPTAIFTSPILQITHAFTNSFANNMAPGVTTNGEGILINNNGNPFTTDITGPDMALGPLGNIPTIDVEISLPPGLEVGDFSSSTNKGITTKEDGRQNVFYSVPSQGSVDTLSFSIVIGWNWILKQIGVYLGGIVLAMVLLFVWRKHRVGKKSKRLENEFEFAARKALNQNAMPAAGAMMVGSGGYDEFGNPRGGGQMDDDLAQFMY